MLKRIMPALLMCLCGASYAVGMQEPLPPLNDGKAPQSLDEMWVDFNPQAEPLFQVLREAVEKMVGPLIALINQRIMHFERFDVGIGFVKRCEMRVVLPQLLTRCADVDLELPRRCDV